MSSRRLASALVLLSLGLSGAWVAQPPVYVAFVDVTVLPMDQDRRLDHQTVLVQDGVIATMGPAGAVTISPRALRIDGRGKFLLPGLADTHVHVDDTTDFLLYLAKGVTTVRNLEGQPYHLHWRKQIEAGELVGPTIFTSGPFTNLPEIKTPDDARRAVEEQKAAGYDEIKIHGGLEAETYDTLAAVAHRLGIRLVGHAPRNLPFENLLRNHQDEISHAEEVLYTYFKSDVSDTSVAKIPLVARALKERDIWMTATFMTYDRIYAQVANLDSLLADPATAYVTPYQLALWQRENNRYIRNWGPNGVPTLRARRDFLVKLIRGLYQGGVRIMTGTDAIGPLWIPGWSLHEELRDFVAMGFTPYDALSAATRLPAEYLGQAEVFGTIAPGRRADLVLLDRDPMADIRNTESIRGVMVRGRWFPRADLDQKLARLAQANRAEERMVQRIVDRGIVVAAHQRCTSSQPPLLVDAQRLLDLRLTSVFTQVVRDSGVAVAERMATTVRSQCPEAVLFSEGKINAVGAAFRAQHRLDRAVPVLEFNSRLFPESFLSHYWLGEALLERGDTARAIVSYRRSVELDPGMTEAIAKLKELGDGPQVAPNPSKPRSAIEQIDSMTLAEYARDSIGSVTMGLVVNRKLVWTKSYGYADRERKIPATMETEYRIASVTKLFTGLMLLQLVEAGRVHLSDPVDKYFPEINRVRGRFPGAPPITLVQLATMTAGLAGEPENAERYNTGRVADWERQLLQSLPDTKYLHEPGVFHEYSNTSYAVLGAALGRAAGEPYVAYVQNHIIEPLGLTHTAFEPDALISPRLARGYHISDTGLDTLSPQRQQGNRGKNVPAGSLYSTVGDLAAFMAFELGEDHPDVLRKESLDSSFAGLVAADADLNYGDGVAGFSALRRMPAHFVAVGHLGTLPGYSAALIFDRSSGTGVVMLSNVTGGKADYQELAQRALAILAASAN